MRLFHFTTFPPAVTNKTKPPQVGGRGVRKIIRKHDPVGLNGAYAPVV